MSASPVLFPRRESSFSLFLDSNAPTLTPLPSYVYAHEKDTDGANTTTTNTANNNGTNNQQRMSYAYDPCPSPTVAYCMKDTSVYAGAGSSATGFDFAFVPETGVQLHEKEATFCNSLMADEVVSMPPASFLADLMKSDAYFVGGQDMDAVTRSDSPLSMQSMHSPSDSGSLDLTPPSSVAFSLDSPSPTSEDDDSSQTFSTTTSQGSEDEATSPVTLSRAPVHNTRSRSNPRTHTIRSHSIAHKPKHITDESAPQPKKRKAMASSTKGKSKSKSSARIREWKKQVMQEDSDAQELSHMCKRDRNKVSAARYRKRRKQFYNLLEEKVEELDVTAEEQEIEISVLKEEKASLLSQLASMRSLLSAHAIAAPSADASPSSSKKRRGMVFFALFACLLFIAFPSSDLSRSRSTLGASNTRVLVQNSAPDTGMFSWITNAGLSLFNGGSSISQMPTSGYDSLNRPSLYSSDNACKLHGTDLDALNLDTSVSFAADGATAFHAPVQRDTVNTFLAGARPPARVHVGGLNQREL